MEKANSENGKNVKHKQTRLLSKLTALVVINAAMLYMLYINNQIDSELKMPKLISYSRVNNNQTTINKSEASILYNLARTSTPACYRQIQFWMGPKKAVKPTEHECPGVSCGIRHVQDTSLQTMQNSDAVVLFHRSSWNWAEMHQHRPPRQKWIFYTLESPRHTNGHVIPPAPYYTNSYDYTIGFREHSTFIASYGYYDPTEPEITDDKTRDWSGEKTGLIAWVASNCNVASWRRLQFVRALSKHIKIDMYGACGNLTFPRNPKGEKLIKTYKFYLAIENSECRDYITEKFWRNSLLNGVVPVVYGTIKEDYERVAPPNSFIHLHDFASLTQVADFLHTVAGNVTQYNSYLEWKRHGSIKFNRNGEHLGPEYLCRVVKRLLEDEKNKVMGIEANSSVPDLNSWWKGSCNVGSGFPRDF